MQESAPRNHAVLMGDIVGSEAADDVDALHRRFNFEVNAANSWFKPQLISPLTITLGDEFQGLLTSLDAAILLARAMRHAMLSKDIECRVAIGVASIPMPVNPERAWNMMGPGLAATREKLADKAAPARYRFHLPGEPVVETLLDAVAASLTAIEARWTPTQLHDISQSIGGAAAEDIAQRRNVGVHTVYKVRRTGEYDLYSQQWQAVRAALASLAPLYGLN